MIALLIKSAYCIDKEIQANYGTDIDFKVFSLFYKENNKISATEAKKYLNKLLPSIIKDGITTLYVCDALYFKLLTKQTKAETHIGYVLPCALKGFEHLSVIYGINYAQLLYNPNLYSQLDLSLSTLKSHINGTYKSIGQGIIHNAEYTAESLPNLLKEPELTIDIETSGLELGSELISIGFATDIHNGIAFKVQNKKMLKTFFEQYQGNKIFHNATFDVKHIIYHCFMDNPNDMRGMLHGLHTMYRNLHDTKIIAYLATNNTQGNTLGLKELSQEYVGNYAVDFDNVTDEALLEYNLKDCLATKYVFNKYYPKMLQDNQKHIYDTLMLPSLKVITQMELCGMPINYEQVLKTQDNLEEIYNEHLEVVMNSNLVDMALDKIKQIELDKINAKLKTKKHNISHLADYTFNPSSGKHLSVLLYDICGLPIIDYTDTKLPATGAKTLEKLLNHTEDYFIQRLLTALIGLNKVSKILTTFIPAFLKAKKRDGYHYLHGNFNLGGTLSGRLSSSNP